MVAFFKKEDGGMPNAEVAAQNKLGFGENERKRIYVIATIVLLLLAVVDLALTSGTKGQGSCGGIPLQNQRNTCFFVLAGNTGNVLVCNNIASSDMRSSCILGIAEARKDIGMCSLLGNATTAYSQCVMNLSSTMHDLNYCQMLDDAHQSACAFAYAELSMFSDMATCSIIKNSSMGMQCGYMYYYNSAIRLGSVQYCTLLPNSIDYTLMALMLADGAGNYTTTESQQAMYATLNTSPQNYCYYSVAVTSGNKTACALTTGILNTVCNSTAVNINSTINVIDINNLTSVCSVAPSYMRDLCEGSLLVSEAINTGNISRCMQITSKQYEYTCITAYSKKYANASYCSYIDNQVTRENCYVSVEGTGSNQSQ
jgi:hypothetical protein